MTQPSTPADVLAASVARLGQQRQAMRDLSADIAAQRAAESTKDTTTEGAETK